MAGGDVLVAEGDTGERDHLLVAAVRRAVSDTGGHAASVFLRSRDRRSLVLAASCGAPPSLLGGWRLIPVSSPIPVAVAYRSGRTVHLADAHETMRRYPQLAVALPYMFGSASVPVRTDAEHFGALSVVWATEPGDQGLPRAQRRQLRATANRLGAALAGLRAGGDPVECDPRTAAVEVPAPARPSLRVGLLDWEPATDQVVEDEGLCTVLGLAHEAFDGTFAGLTAKVAPGDLAAFRAEVRAASDGRVFSQRLRVWVDRSRQRTVELWARVSRLGPTAGDGSATRVVGAVVDAGDGASAVAATERLADGVLALDTAGRLTCLNGSLELLLQVRREEVLGRRIWDVLPWLSAPTYENRFRAALVSQRTISFLACRPPDQWLAFSFHPDPSGVTGRVVPVDGPTAAAPAPADSAIPGTATPETATPETEIPDTAPSTGLAMMYHVLQLGSALTQAVTAREVGDVVAHQLLPAFGGQQAAIYLAQSGLLHLLARTACEEAFPLRLEGASLQAHLPGTEALTSGVPLFVESPQALADGYPGSPVGESRAWAFLPLIACSRPIGTCVLGFDRIHPFTIEERGALTSMGGLIAQALERARLYDEESAIARGLQDALLPHRLPSLPNIRTAARYLPGTRGMDIGGDWYDVVPAGRSVTLVVGDVEGHSVAAAATMGQLRSAARAYTTAGQRPGQVVTGTNRLLVDLDSGLLASCCYLSLDAYSGRVRAVRAGHCPPLLRQPDGTAEVLDLPGGTLLGVDPASSYPESLLTLRPGSVLALYTDGLVEERGTGIDQGIDRLRAALAHARSGSLEALADHLLHGAERLTSRADDIALLLAEYRPSAEPT
ncbi:SpoIIE family protein phosphatase [Kitasatospora sp. NPDC056138]|uniref:SpoIIE family protein phosphatase n=1 Tax=Kitasatospora sp. NPDC056138 TaxID=3345724 RepID=UPI0035DF649F